MRLEFLFIEDYRAIKNQGFNISNQFSFDFDFKLKSLKINKNEFYIDNFFGNNISSFTGIIGENGVGKTTLFNFVKEVLAFPKSTSKLENYCLLIFFDEKTSKFLIVNNLTSQKELIIADKTGSIFEVKKLLDFVSIKNENDLFDFESKFTILESIPGLNELAIVYLSNVLDYNRRETTYGPSRSPEIFNYSSNFLLKVNSLESPLNTFMRDETKRIINFVVNAKEIKPHISLPNAITLFFNFGDLQTIYDNQEKLGAKENIFKIPETNVFLNKLRDLGQKARNNEKEQATLFWLTNFSFLETLPFIKKSKVLDYFSAIDLTSVKSFSTTFHKVLETPTKYLEFTHKGLPFKLNSNYWTEFSKNYKALFSLTIELFENRLKKTKDSFNSFTIPLNSDNYEKIKDFLDLIGLASLTASPINFTWRQISTGEAAVLALFSRLYELSDYLNKNPDNKISKLWLLLDESESHFHPQWQKQFIKLFIDFIKTYFSNFNCQIFLASHSPLVISDLPKSNIVFLKKATNGKIIAQNSLNDHRQTFASNINVLLADSFFIHDGLIGDFANEKINEVIELLVEGSIDELINNKDYIESLINIIGEPVIKVKLLSMLENRMRANLITLKSDINILMKNKKNFN